MPCTFETSYKFMRFGFISPVQPQDELRAKSSNMTFYGYNLDNLFWTLSNGLTACDRGDQSAPSI